ncbi:MAG: hypothetical protein ACR2PI_17755 [Hyphomicrobiaceae bacterium]
MAKGILAVAFDFSPTHPDEFHDWYDLEHLPERQAINGFGTSERWLGADEPHYACATYDLDTVDVLKSAAYLAVGYDNASPWTKRVVAQCNRLMRFEGEQLTPGNLEAPPNAGGLLINAMNVTSAAEADFNAWYDEEHLPALGAVPGCLAARRYRSTEAGGGLHKYLAIYHLESPDVARSDAWKEAADTPWSSRVRPHFRDRLRILTNRYRRAA